MQQKFLFFPYCLLFSKTMPRIKLCSNLGFSVSNEIHRIFICCSGQKNQWEIFFFVNINLCLFKVISNLLPKWQCQIFAAVWLIKSCGYVRSTFRSVLLSYFERGCRWRLPGQPKAEHSVVLPRRWDVGWLRASVPAGGENDKRIWQIFTTLFLEMPNSCKKVFSSWS